MNIGIIDCGGANLNSIYYSFKRININASISDSPSELEEHGCIYFTWSWFCWNSNE